MSDYLSKLKSLENKNISHVPPSATVSKVPKVPISDPFDTYGTVAPHVQSVKNLKNSDAELEQRREKVLKILEENPDSSRAVITETEHDMVIVAIAIRGVASFEMLIAKKRYDPFLMMELLDGGIETINENNIGGN